MPMTDQELANLQAHQTLAEQGSVMAQPPQTQAISGNHPILNPAIGALGDLFNALGPTPVDAFAGKAAELAGKTGLVQMLSQALGLSGQSQLGQEAGVYRQLGMQRAGNLLNPAEYIQKLQELPNYKRYLELVQNMVKRGLGESFPVARGKAQTDPLMQALQQQLSGAKLPATAVTYGVNTGGFSNTAEDFARQAAEKTRKPAYVASGMATPQDVAALVPRRQAYTHEKELVLQPTEAFSPQLTARYVPPSGQFPWVERKALQPTNPTQAELLQALTEALQPVK